MGMSPQIKEAFAALDLDMVDLFVCLFVLENELNVTAPSASAAASRRGGHFSLLWRYFRLSPDLCPSLVSVTSWVFVFYSSV